MQLFSKPSCSLISKEQGKGVISVPSSTSPTLEGRDGEHDSYELANSVTEQKPKDTTRCVRPCTPHLTGSPQDGPCQEALREKEIERRAGKSYRPWCQPKA